LLVSLACQPLDRRDGSLVIVLSRVPAQVDAIEVTVRAGARSFEELVARPNDDRITDFSAVPAGPAELDLRLFAGSELIDARLAIGVEIVEDAVVELPVSFESGPDFTIEDPREGERHLVRDGGGITVVVQPVNSALLIDMTATANGEPVALVENGTFFVGEIDPSLAGSVLPAQIVLKVLACLEEVPSSCIERERSVAVTRAPWRLEVAPQTLSRPRWWRESILLVDGAGTLRALTSTGGDALDPIALSTPVAEDVALSGDLVHVTARDGRLLTLDLTTRMTSELDLGATSAPISFAMEVVVAADRDLIRLPDVVVGSLPHRVRAPPLVDPDGIVAADIQGHVMAFDPAGATLFLTDAGAPVFAQPVRHRDRIVIAASSGEVLQLDPFSGAEAVPRLHLTGAIAHAPLVIGERLIAAADDRVVFIADTEITASVRVGATITAAPVRWGDAAVVGLQNGLVRRVTESGSRVIERVGGAVLGLLVIDSLGPGRGAGIVAVGSGGDLALLEPEEGF
jgi:hypothetical protein